MLYQMGDDGRAILCKQVHATNEAEELQEVLETNLFLLPGDQIDPEVPRRWMLVRREMPVPDPSDGTSRWSVDLLLSDQSGIPTFVECKRFADTRSRREVVGQMLEYAANGHHYWDQSDLRRYMEESASHTGRQLSEVFADLGAEDFENVDELIERFVENLREGQVRLVFFMEEAPQELKSIVDFLNRQTERTEILIVEARQYDGAGGRFVVPSLFGYTEEARRAKRSVTVSTGQRRRKWTEETFFHEVSTNLTGNQSAILRQVHDFARDLDLEIRWGTGANRGTMSLVASSLCPRSFLSIYTDGDVSFNVGWLDGSVSAEGLGKSLRDGVVNTLGLIPKNPDAAYWMFSPEDWISQSERFMEVVRDAVSTAEYA